MKKKSKKKLWGVLLIVLIVTVGLLTAGYVAVNKAFSVLTDSFYKSSVTIENPPSDSNENQTEGQGEGQNGAAEKGQTSSDGAQTALPDEISRAAERYGVSPEKLKLTTAEVKELEKKVSFADKVAVLNILSSGLSASEYKELIGMLNDGISSSDMKRAYQILSKSLSTENKGKILQYYQKYADLIK